MHCHAQGKCDLVGFIIDIPSKNREPNVLQNLNNANCNQFDKYCIGLAFTSP